MIPTPFRLLAVTSIERHAATRLARRAISEAGAWITNFQQFSNFAIVLELEIEPTRYARLLEALKAVGLAPDPSTTEPPVWDEGVEDLSGALRIEFIHDEPDLSVPVPAVPG